MTESIFPFELSFVQLVLAWAVVAVGAALHGAVGFGLGIIGAPLLVLIAPGLVPGPLLLVAFVLTLLMTYRERRAVDLSGMHWAIAGRFVGVVLAALALGPQLLGHIGLNYVVRFMPATIVAAALLLEPVGATALGAMVLDELPGWREVAGGVVVLAGVLIATVRTRKITGRAAGAG